MRGIRPDHRLPVSHCRGIMPDLTGPWQVLCHAIARVGRQPQARATGEDGHLLLEREAWARR